MEIVREVFQKLWGSYSQKSLTHPPSLTKVKNCQKRFQQWQKIVKILTFLKKNPRELMVVIMIMGLTNVINYLFSIPFFLLEVFPDLFWIIFFISFTGGLPLPLLDSSFLLFFIGGLCTRLACLLSFASLFYNKL